ncbi:MAG TPA: hypothetical protein VF192_04140 [Longimicrobiales bacterium]
MVLRHWSLRALALALVGGLAAACGDDEPDLTDPVPETLAGDWEATPECRPPCAFTVIPVANPADSISLLDLSASVEVSIRTGGGFVLRLQLPDVGVLPLAGTARTEGSTIYVTGPRGVDTATYSLANDLLTLEYQNELEGIDFDEDGTPDRGRVRAVLRRK